jgi:predicted acylesterase/phospholipase RssA
MKGGITSGVIYPAAAAKLATRYCFKNIGGTSAGAIAASVVAAAEYGRRAGHPSSFDVLSALPTNLASNGHLLKLFTPDERTSKIFRIALGTMTSTSTPGKIFKAVFGTLLASPLASIPAFLIGLILPALTFSLLRWQSLTPLAGLLLRHWAVCAISGAITGFVLALIASVYQGGRAAIEAIASNGFGLCSGMASQTGAGGSLTEWIDQQIQTAAGRTITDPALTFGDLWHAPAYPGETLVTPEAVTLKVVTTGLSDGRPFTIPFLDGALYFDPEEWKSYFPDRILTAMAKAGEALERQKHPLTPGIKPTGDDRDVETPAGLKLCRLPGNPDLPILVATRMSLSFPALLSAVPLYRVDYHITRNQRIDTAHDKRVGSKVWFSDGGICSNFPIGFFDSPLPRWPTFGINLQPAAPTACTTAPRDPKLFVTLPKSFGVGPAIGNSLGDAVWTPTGVTEQHDPLVCTLDFAHAIMNTMQNWQDNLQAASPGYRDRIVSVNLCKDEGGLNLNMPPALITALSGRGEEAANQLITSFDFSQHAFTRFRVTLCALQDYLHQLDTSYSHPIHPQDDQGLSYINGTQTPPHYKWDHTNIRDKAAEALVQLQTLIHSWENQLKEPEGFCTNAPQPKGLLQSRPTF